MDSGSSNTISALDGDSKVASVAVKDCIPLARWLLDHVNVMPFDVYVAERHAKQAFLYRAKNFEVDSETIRLFRQDKDRIFYVCKQEQEAFETAANAVLNDMLEDDSSPPDKLLDLLYTTSILKLRTSYGLINSDAAIASSLSLGERLGRVMRRSKMLPTDIHRLNRHNPDTLTHVVTVSYYAAVLARRLGISNPRELTQITTGALLHDLGKRRIPNYILDAERRLTDEERIQMQRHPQTAYEELRRREDVSRDQLMMVYQHHERIDGKGYPVGLIGDEIHPWARLCAVVDVFEAMTGKRNYHATSRIDDVCAALEKMRNTSLDGEMVRCWNSMILSR